jgi:DNA helicase II / ATP-dependent DNA helicase PcrA
MRTAGLPSAPTTGIRPRLSTFHQVKGDQAEAVLLLMAASSVTDRTLSAWLTGGICDPEVAEALRVMYVGVTRARRLLGLAVPASDRERLLAYFQRRTIPTELR